MKTGTKTKTKTLPTRPAKPFADVVKLGALETQYDAMPKIKADEVFQGLKGKADKGENFTRFAYLAWKGSINADQVESAFSGALRVAMLAAFDNVIQGRDQNSPLPGEVVGRAWAGANEAWAECPEREPKIKEEAEQDPEQASIEVLEHRNKHLIRELEKIEAMIDAIALCGNIKAVRALLQKNNYIEAEAA